MEEKVIIRGEFTKRNDLSILLYVLGVVSFITSLSIYGPGPHMYDLYWDYILWPQAAEGITIFLWLAILLFIIATILLIGMGSCEIVVTNKRVYGKTAFSKSIDLPYDKISSVGTCFPMGVFAATSSGVIKFWCMTNKEEVYGAISGLLQERQMKTGRSEIKIEQSAAEELRKFKDLYDAGIITKEEFEAKKKQLLGI